MSYFFLLVCCPMLVFLLSFTGLLPNASFSGLQFTCLYFRPAVFRFSYYCTSGQLSSACPFTLLPVWYPPIVLLLYFRPAILCLTLYSTSGLLNFNFACLFTLLPVCFPPLVLLLYFRGLQSSACPLLYFRYAILRLSFYSTSGLQSSA